MSTFSDMLWGLIFLILVAYSVSQDKDNEGTDEYDNIREVIANLSLIFENPKIANHTQLIQTGILYLDKLLFLEDEVKCGTPKAERMIRQLYYERAQDQLENVPLSILIGHYGWNSLEVGEFENIIQRAKEIWRYFIDEVHYGSFESTTPWMW